MGAGRALVSWLFTTAPLPLTLPLLPPRPAARSPRRTWLPGPQRGCGRPRGAGLPRAPGPSRTGGRPRRARTARETGRGGESASRRGGLPGRKSLGSAAPVPRLGAPPGSRVPGAGSKAQTREGGRGCGRRGFSQLLKILLERNWEQGGVSGRRSSSAGGQGLLPERPSLLQGRDASDQHIVDVVLKMLQGEGRSRQPLAVPGRTSGPAGSLQVALPRCSESWVLIAALPARD